MGLLDVCWILIIIEGDNILQEMSIIVDGETKDAGGLPVICTDPCIHIYHQQGPKPYAIVDLEWLPGYLNWTHWPYMSLCFGSRGKSSIRWFRDFDDHLLT